MRNLNVVIPAQAGIQSSNWFLRRLKTWTPAFAGVTLAFSVSSLAATRYIPVFNGVVTTGQWFADGHNSSMGGNVGFTFIPAVRFSSALSLIPMFESNYRGTQSAQELAGGNTLFQDTWENAVGLKAVHELNDDWKVKERIGVRQKWSRETADETWNHGLYDYRTYTMGAEVERSLGRSNYMSLGYDFTYLQFPNYQSLESQQPDTISREFAGAHPLDNMIHLFSLNAAVALPWSLASGLQLYASPRFYSDQTIVQSSGLLSADKRKDMYFGSAFSLDRPFLLPAGMGLMTSVNFGYSVMNSNQNHYDARFTQFVANYYDYNQERVGGGLALSFGRTQAGPMMANLGGNFYHRTYPSRTIQASDGSYLSDKLYINETDVNLSFTYPLSKVLRLQLSSSVGKSASNNQYEAVYRYNYRTADYLFGFTYDY